MTTSYEEIDRNLRDLLRAYVDDATPVRADSLLVDDLGLDSVQTMEMLMDLEDRLDAAIPLNVLPDVQTLDDLIKALQDLLSKGTSD